MGEEIVLHLGVSFFFYYIHSISDSLNIQDSFNSILKGFFLKKKNQNKVL